MKMDADVKEGMEQDCSPFYSESNIRYLEKKIEEYKAGQIKFEEHELIEE